ncbi:MAG TPA: hypothetical protein PK747_06875 [Acidobacteriota bacterium]|nr:hypothetical protein [Acidobacteriota bacterium]HNT17349.1 hypothetical protein [Acidobacteriota bacterium]HPA27239.1 hypothetical protein [Acidobacteriota bacterium]HQO19194.1 hypothetical protein [Acidobacteriota bacterium]HQQ47116.1 hypothetical protein [Acidobacteriota bacterium]
MYNYYKHFGIDPTAGHEEVKGALDMAYQDLQRKGGSQEQYRILREAQDTLLNPINRVEYDKKLGIKPPKPEKSVNESTHISKSAVALMILAAVAILLGILYIPAKIKGTPRPGINPGVYLVSTSTGESSAVLRKFEAEHDFADGEEHRGYEILVIDSGEVIWITEEELLSDYTAGSYAPRDLVSGTGR